jgi:hypothetical protein
VLLDGDQVLSWHRAWRANTDQARRELRTATGRPDDHAVRVIVVGQESPD